MGLMEAGRVGLMQFDIERLTIIGSAGVPPAPLRRRVICVDESLSRFALSEAETPALPVSTASFPPGLRGRTN